MNRSGVHSLLLAAILTTAAIPVLAQEDHAKGYQYPADPLVAQKLEHWRDVKFGLLMHWGTYSQWGIVESWSLCPEDEGWCERRGPFAGNWYEYKKAYENLSTTFNPTRFNPEKWAAAAKAAGMKYVVFTTKHHDGFCMFDTRTTDYKITGARSPFAGNPKSNVAREIFNAFRNQGIMTGAYFSKPDWHCPDYWWSYFPPKDRNVSYDPRRYPQRWQAYKDFTYTQISELMSNYGAMDILWLDGGWVRPFSSIDTAVSWQKTIPYDQDIDMKKIAAMARQKQPGLLIVDRTVRGEFENYATPEQQVPAHAMNIPWESCMTMAGSWSYVPNDQYKSVQQIVHLLCTIVSRGGNLLLNIAPGPDGEWDAAAYQRLEGIGAWLKVNGEAIYGTRISPAARESREFKFTAKGDTLYALHLPADGRLKASLQLEPGQIPIDKPAQIRLLGGGKLKWVKTEKGITVFIPEQYRKQAPAAGAWCLAIFK